LHRCADPFPGLLLLTAAITRCVQTALPRASRGKDIRFYRPRRGSPRDRNSIQVMSSACKRRSPNARYLSPELVISAFPRPEGPMPNNGFSKRWRYEPRAYGSFPHRMPQVHARDTISHCPEVNRQGVIDEKRYLLKHCMLWRRGLGRFRNRNGANQAIYFHPGRDSPARVEPHSRSHHVCARPHQRPRPVDRLPDLISNDLQFTAASEKPLDRKGTHHVAHAGNRNLRVQPRRNRPHEHTEID
jgi:hypothetical protein